MGKHKRLHEKDCSTLLRKELEDQKRRFNRYVGKLTKDMKKIKKLHKRRQTLISGDVKNWKSPDSAEDLKFRHIKRMMKTIHDCVARVYEHWGFEHWS